MAGWMTWFTPLESQIGQGTTNRYPDFALIDQDRKACDPDCRITCTCWIPGNTTEYVGRRAMTYRGRSCTRNRVE